MELSQLKCEIVGYRNQASCGFRSIVGSSDGELPCTNDAVETVCLLRKGYDLAICEEHLSLFPAHALDCDIGRDGS